MEGIELAIVRGAVAGKLRAAARGKDEKTAIALQRAADRYSAGAREALAQMGVAGNAERSAPGPAGHSTGLGRFTRPAVGEG